ncbi:MAG: hypothetical protein KGK07_11370 [Chloroflexota bacterium]|nr:hypothetical protein [Chloroflexota bacterium]
MKRLQPLLEEVIAATAAVGALGVLVGFVYWLLTGQSPWPGLVLGEMIGFGWGVLLLVIAAPQRGK